MVPHLGPLKDAGGGVGMRGKQMEKGEGSRAYRHAEFGYKIRKVWGWMDGWIWIFL